MDAIMNTLSDWIQRLMQKAFWQTFLQGVDWIDIAFAIFVLIGLVYGARKGLMRELAEIFELLIFNFLVYRFFEKIIIVLSNNFPGLSQGVTAPAGFILTAMAVGVILTVIDSYLKRLVHTQLIAPIRVLGGMILGVCQWVFLLSFISQAILLLPIGSLHKTYLKGNSHTGQWMAKLSPEVYKRMTSWLEKPRES